MELKQTQQYQQNFHNGHTCDKILILDLSARFQVDTPKLLINIKTYDCVSQAILEVDNQEPVLYHDSCFGNEDYDIDVEAYQIRGQIKIESCR